MNARPYLRLLDSCSIAAGAENEDGWGHWGQWAWVLDGATPTASETDHLPGSPAAELVGALDLELLAAARSEPDSCASAVRTAIRGATRRRSEQSCNARPASSCLGLVRLQADRLGYLLLGDVTLVVDRRRSITVVDDPSATGREVEYLRRADGEREQLDRVLARARRTMNRPGGYWIAADEPEAADHGEQGSIQVEPADLVLLATDGFARAVDLLGSYRSWRALIAAAHSQGLAEIAAGVRQAEARDPARTRWPRAKVHDDCTAALYQVGSMD